MSEFKYKDILNMKYPNPEIERDFPDKILREAQFAPFAALTGYNDAIDEAARQTDRKIGLDEYEIERLNNKLKYLSEVSETDEVVITYYVPDKKKDGGAYVSKSGIVIKVREYERDIVTDDGTKIPIEDIYSISGKMFDDFDV
ncbi:MAG: hypothetical protein SOX82_08840 [Eubacteriales bacterium]|nr:hypothetical protein [Eubacteriales bacterium]MDY4213770.1 hypothetical protein [Eubacteriales bacterium]MDY5231273.1 hypothetical protein [Eubacteriales bacterium]